MSSDPLVSLSPTETLVFELEKDTAPKAVLKVTNTSQNKVVFKVKTTQPTWYYVRPNQQVIDVGQTEEVAIVLVDSECTRFLERAAEDKAERLDKHRFLVQTKIIEDEDYDKIVAVSVSQKTEEYTRIWGAGPKEDRKNLKLKVDFNYPTLMPRTVSVDTLSNKKNNDMKEKADVRNRLSRVEEHSSKKSTDDEVQNNPESLLADLLNLRMKYDAVVEYTVHLTAERDTFVQRLEESDRELARENARKKNNLESLPKLKKSEKMSEKVTAQKVRRRIL